MGAAAARNVKEYEMWVEARFRGTCGVEVGLPARGDICILHVISYSRLGLAASGNMHIFLD